MRGWVESCRKDHQPGFSIVTFGETGNVLEILEIIIPCFIHSPCFAYNIPQHEKCFHAAAAICAGDQHFAVISSRIMRAGWAKVQRNHHGDFWKLSTPSVQVVLSLQRLHHPVSSEHHAHTVICPLMQNCQKEETGTSEVLKPQTLKSAYRLQDHHINENGC